MLVDLVAVTSRDGVRLDGMFQPASGPSTLPIDVVCFVHGTGGNFYASTLFDQLGERFLARGCGVLRVNTRGHDGISTALTQRGGRRLGAAYERVDDCRHDLTAWVDFLRQEVGPRIGLLGHSLGAVKCLYALASEPGLGVTCLAAVSPPRLSYSAFCLSAQASEFLGTYQEADGLVARNQGDALLDIKLPLPFVITAAGYVEKYGPDERYNFLNSVACVPCPVLFTFGSLEVETNMAFRGVPELVADWAQRRPQVQVAIVPGADHFYSGARDKLVAAVEDWLRGISPIHSSE
jgi:pimeloyl-ACP methyl ester carboxylesterase